MQLALASRCARSAPPPQRSDCRLEAALRANELQLVRPESPDRVQAGPSTRTDLEAPIMDDADVSIEMFRDGMARLGSSANVITSNGPTGRLGFTATSVWSLSDRPPSLIVCMNRSSAQNTLFKTNGVLCVNVLTPDYRELSAAFAGIGHCSGATSSHTRSKPRFDRPGILLSALARICAWTRLCLLSCLRRSTSACSNSLSQRSSTWSAV